MFINRALFDEITGAYKNFLADLREHTETALDRVLAAKESEVHSVIAAKDDQLAFLRAEMVTLRQLVEHERARAEKAIDQLLTRKDALPVSLADLERELASEQLRGKAGEPQIPRPAQDKAAALKEIYAQVNGVGEDAPEEVDLTTTERIGGHPVAA